MKMTRNERFQKILDYLIPADNTEEFDAASAWQDGASDEEINAILGIEETSPDNNEPADSGPDVDDEPTTTVTDEVSTGPRKPNLPNLLYPKSEVSRIRQFFPTDARLRQRI